jgi:hypothetical protein
VVCHLSHQRHPDRPSELDPAQIIADGLPVAPAQRLKPLPDGLSA